MPMTIKQMQDKPSVSLLEFLSGAGLITSKDSRVKEFKALDDDDKQYFVDRAKVEYNINVVRPT